MDCPRISLTVRGGDVRVPGSGLTQRRCCCDAVRKIPFKEVLSEEDESLLLSAFCLLHCNMILSSDSVEDIVWGCPITLMVLPLLPLQRRFSPLIVRLGRWGLSLLLRRCLLSLPVRCGLSIGLSSCCGFAGDRFLLLSDVFRPGRFGRVGALVSFVFLLEGLLSQRQEP